MKPLEGKVAVVAGATRGAGRGIACMLGEAGAIVYCTGRSIEGKPSPLNRPETIEETARMVNSHGGVGIGVQVDHTKPDQVKALFEKVGQEQKGHLDILVNNISGNHYIDPAMLSGEKYCPFWEYSLEKGLKAQQAGIQTHIITSYYAAPLMVTRQQGLIIEITDGNHLGYNSSGVFFSLTKTSAILLAYLMSEELQKHNVAVVSLTPGWMRSEEMLDNFGVSEENWKDMLEHVPDFVESETPFYVGRAVVGLATDPNIMKKTGFTFETAYLAREYDFTDIDGTQKPVHILPGVFKNGGFAHLEE